MVLADIADNKGFCSTSQHRSSTGDGYANAVVVTDWGCEGGAGTCCLLVAKKSVKLRRGVHRRGHGNCPYQNPAIQLDHAVAHPVYALRRLVLLELIRPGQTSLAQHRLTVTDDTLACNTMCLPPQPSSVAPKLSTRPVPLSATTSTDKF